MPNDQSHKHPMVYEIKVSGRIDPERAAWFGNMSLNVKHTKEGLVTTVLSGQVRDQAALFGILNRIRDLGLKLISVNRIEYGLVNGNGKDNVSKKEETQ